MKKIYGGEYFQSPSSLNNSLMYQVVLPYTLTYAHMYTHIQLRPEMLCMNLISTPEYRDTYQSHMFFPQFLYLSLILMALLPISHGPLALPSDLAYMKKYLCT